VPEVVVAFEEILVLGMIAILVEEAAARFPNRGIGRTPAGVASHGPVLQGVCHDEVPQ
jgi:hypothetical protein